MDSLQVHPLLWSDEWDRRGSVHSGSVGTFHRLTEMGKTSNGYEYVVTTYPEYTKYSVQILKVILRPTCCRGMRTCPIGKRELPEDCRQHLRQEAERLAYETWVQYIKNLVGIQQ